MWFLILLLVGVSFAQQCRPPLQFYQDRERGWFWKEECVKEEKRKEEKKEEKKEEVKKEGYRLLASRHVKIPWHIIDRLDPEEIARLEEESRKIAMMNPTPENVSEYRKLLRFIGDRSRAFALAGYIDLKTSPYPFQPQQYLQVRVVRQEERDRRWAEIFRSYKSRAGLVVMVQKDCPYCQAFKGVLRAFGEETGWQYREVEISQNPSLATNLGTETVPDVFLVLQKDGRHRWQRIGSGFMPLAELKASVILGLYTLGEVKDENLLDW